MNNFAIVKFELYHNYRMAYWAPFKSGAQVWCDGKKGGKKANDQLELTGTRLTYGSRSGWSILSSSDHLGAPHHCISPEVKTWE